VTTAPMGIDPAQHAFQVSSRHICQGKGKSVDFMVSRHAYSFLAY